MTTPPSDNESMSLYMRAIRRHLRLVVILPVVLSLTALAGNLLRSRAYLAKAAFVASEPSSMSGSLGSLGAVASQLGIPALSSIASSSANLSPQFYGDLLTSNSVLHSLVTTRYDASAVAENGGKPFSGTLVDYIDPNATTETDRVLAAMTSVSRSILSVTVDRTTGIIRMEVRTKNRQLSALISRRLLDLVNEFNLHRRQTQASAERDFDQRRAKAALDTLHEAETALADFRSANIDFSRSPRLSAEETAIQRRVAVAQQVYTTIVQKYELANIEAVRNTPVITVLDAPEGLVEARPRYTRQIALGAFVAGLLLAAVLAVRIEQRTARSPTFRAE